MFFFTKYTILIHTNTTTYTDTAAGTVSGEGKIKGRKLARKVHFKHNFYSLYINIQAIKGVVRYGRNDFYKRHYNTFTHLLHYPYGVTNIVDELDSNSNGVLH